MNAPIPPVPEPPPVPVGWLATVKGMTLTNAAVVVVLVIALIPAYAVYRLLTDATLLDKFLSHYTTEPTGTACRLVKARERGEQYTWAITTGFAFEGQSRWSLGVVMNHEPTGEEIQTYCLMLQTIIDFMHGRGPPPDIIWQQKDIEGHEGVGR